MTARRVTVDLVEDDGDTVLVEDLKVMSGSYFTEEDSDAGAAEATLPTALGLSDTELLPQRLLRWKVDGEAKRTTIIERADTTYEATTNAQKATKLTCRDWLAEFADAPAPAVGVPAGSSLIPATVRFDWTNPHLPRPWGRPTWVGPTMWASQDPFGDPMTYPGIIPEDDETEGWTDPLAGRVSAVPPVGGVHAPWAHHYAHIWMNVTPGSLVFVWTGDNACGLAVNGVTVDDGYVDWVSQSKGASIFGMDVPSSPVSVAVRILNAPVNPSPCWFSLTAYQQTDGTPRFNWDNVVARTGPDVTLGTDHQLTGGGWYSYDAHATGPFLPPGFEIGRAWLELHGAAQAEGHIPGWACSFTTTHDSAGEPWNITDSLTARVNDDSLLDVMTAWHAQGWWDVAADPAERVLHAWNWKSRGNGSIGSPYATWGPTQYDLASFTTKRR